MRILHVCDSIIGGTGSYLAELLPLQAARYGVENVQLILPYQQRAYVEGRLIDSGISLVYFSRPNRLAGICNVFWKYLQQRKVFQPDIVHAHSFGAGIATRLARLRRTPKIVFCPHGWATDIEFPRVVTVLLTWFERTLSLGADRIVLISRHEERRALEMGISSTKLRTVPNGIENRLPEIAPAVWSDQRLKLLFVGRMDRQKGLDVLLDAVLPILEKVNLHVVGAVVLGGAERDTASDGVEYCGWLDRAGVAAQMKACDALVIPSRWEGFGLVAIEAMRLGVPVIASDVGGLGEILANGQYGISVPVNDPDALRSAILMLTPDRLSILKEIGRKRFESTYTAGRMEKQIADIYQEIA